MPKFLAFLLAFVVATASFVGTSRADALSDALTGFAKDSYSETLKAIEAVVASGSERSLDIITALKEGRLYAVKADKAVFILDASDALTDAATGEPVTGDKPPGLKKVKVNNRVRGAIEAALGSLGLLGPDPAKRLAAAEAVLKSRDTGALPLVEAAIAKETDSAIKQVLEQARAAVLVADDQAAEADRIAAVKVIAARGDEDAMAILRTLPHDAPESVKAAAAGAISQIENSLALWGAAQNVWYGLSLGSVLLLAAIGLAITFGVMGVINMAHGEMVMLGAYTTFVVQELIRTNAPGLFDYSLAIAIPLAFLVSGTAGFIIERSVIRWLYGRPLETLLATWGLSLILQQAIRTIFGANNRQVGNPSWMSGAFDVGHLTITYNRLWIIVFALLVFVALNIILKATPFGLQMRAVTQNRRMAASMGIRTPWIDAFTFALGSGIAGMAGVALSQIDNVSPNLGQGYIIDSFMVVVFGGVGNLWGTLAGALTLGVANKFLEPYSGAVLAKILVLVFIILFIQKRPRGLFALRGRAVES